MLPREWVRGPQWARGARDTWEPRLSAAQAAWGELELVSVTARVREAALVHLSADELVRAGRDCAAVGLDVTALEHDALGLRCAIHWPGAALDWRRAWAARDDEAIGAMLGFPACCREFFRREWVERARRDLTPAMAAYDGPWQANTALRWLGVRLVPHLPCSARCPETLGFADGILAVAEQAQVDVTALELCLRLPVTHSVASGLAIVQTPHFRFMASADVQDWSSVRAAQPASWERNGFSSERAMLDAHAVVVGAVGGSVDSALDLGCGDGALLAKIAQDRPGHWCGIEADRERANGAARHQGVRVAWGRIEALSALADSRGWPRFDVALLMPGRLLEMAPDVAGCVRSEIGQRARRLVTYAYGDVLERFGGLVALCEAARIETRGQLYSGPGVEAIEGVLPWPG